MKTTSFHGVQQGCNQRSERKGGSDVRFEEATEDTLQSSEVGGRTSFLLYLGVFVGFFSLLLLCSVSKTKFSNFPITRAAKEPQLFFRCPFHTSKVNNESAGKKSVVFLCQHKNTAWAARCIMGTGLCALSMVLKINGRSDMTKGKENQAPQMKILRLEKYQTCFTSKCRSRRSANIFEHHAHIISHIIASYSQPVELNRHLND